MDSEKKKDRKISIWALPAVALVSIAITLGAVVFGFSRITGDLKSGVEFLYTLGLVRHSYVGEYDNRKLLQGAMTGMVKTLDDPYSIYLDEKAYNSLHDVTDGSFSGIGVVMGKKDGHFVVVAPMKDSPGEKAGMKSGDRILTVDGKEVSDLELEDLVAKIRGEKGTTVKIGLSRKDTGEKYEVSVVRDDIKIDSVAGEMLPGTKIGYIRIAVFNESTGADFAKVYADLEKQGMKATVLDLRENPGGLLRACMEVSNYLVPKGTVVSITDRNGKTTKYQSNLKEVRYPLAVLVNHGSASASEIVAGAVQDTKAGRLFGVTTYGKGSVQTVYPASEGTALKLTTAKYYTPSGRSINKVGVKPDEVVELPKTEPIFDTQLEAAEAYLKKQLAEKK